MSEISVSVNTSEVSRFMRTVFRDQVPFATSLAINQTTKGIQAEQRKGMRERFTIRRAYVLQGVKVRQFSTKRNLEAIVEISPTRKFLFKFEEGGTVRPRGTSFAVPGGVRRTKTGVVTRAQRPKALGLTLHGKGPLAEVFRGKRRTFLIRRPDGTGAIFQRLGRRGGKRAPRGKRREGRLRLLFSFTPKAEIEPTLDFVLTARTVMRENFARNFEAAFDRAVRSAR